MKREKGRNWLYCLPFLVCLSAFAKQQIRISMARFPALCMQYTSPVPTLRQGTTVITSYNGGQISRSDEGKIPNVIMKTLGQSLNYFGVHRHVRQKRKHLSWCHCPLVVVIESPSLDSHIFRVVEHPSLILWQGLCTASSSHLRTLLLKSSSRPLPAKRPNHAT